MVLVKETLLLKPRLKKYKFKQFTKNKLRVYMKYLVHYTLLWIACVDNYCEIYRALKAKYNKYLIRMYWGPNEKKY